jgi:hypothetical protein
VNISVSNATLTIDGVIYDASTTIYLGPGSYPYTWTALSGYTGSGGGTVIVGDCRPGNATASVSTGGCTWNAQAGSLTPVTITLNHASFTINGVTYTESTTINLPPGSYHFTWTALPGYLGSGEGDLTIGACVPIPVTGPAAGVGPTVLIPVTGVDMGMLGRVLPGTLFGLSFSFAGLGLVLHGFARRRDEDLQD